MLKSMELTHLEVHSYFSFLRGVPSLEELITQALSCNFSAVALTDTNGFYGIIPFYQRCLQAGIKPILGTQLEKDGRKITLLARSKRGFVELSRFITAFHLKQDFNLAQNLKALSEEVILITADQFLLRFLSRELRHPGIYLADYRWNSERGRILRVRNERLTRELSIPRIAVNDVHFLVKDDFEDHKLLRTIDLNTTLERISDEELVDPDCYFFSQEEFLQRWSDTPEALENCERVTRECEIHFKLGQWHFPVYKPHEPDQKSK